MKTITFQAANYLDIKGLLDVTCKTVANMIKGKTPEEIRKTFNIKNDFTEEEEAQVGCSQLVPDYMLFKKVKLKTCLEMMCLYQGDLTWRMITGTFCAVKILS